MNSLDFATRKCRFCGKEFPLTCSEDEWGYGYGKYLMCSYHCMRSYERKMNGYQCAPIGMTAAEREERDRRIIELFTQGDNMVSISKLLGISLTTVKNTLSRYDVKVNTAKSERDIQVLGLRGEGITYKDISKLTGLSYKVVRNIVRKYKGVTA